MSAVSPLVRSFSRAAVSYDAATPVQRAVAQDLVARIQSEIPASFSKQAIEIGCGTGSLTKLFLENFPNATLTAIDLSSRMLAQAKLRNHSDRVQFVLGQFQSLPPSSVELIISASALQWISPFRVAAEAVARNLTPNGTFIAAVMLDGTLAELRDARTKAAPQKPQRALPSIPEIELALREVGFRQIRIDEVVYSTGFSGVPELFAALRAAGVTRDGSNRLTRGELSRVAELLSKNDELKLSYRVGFLRATRTMRAS